jgi:hypothetical protein
MIDKTTPFSVATTLAVAALLGSVAAFGVAMSRQTTVTLPPSTP